MADLSVSDLEAFAKSIAANDIYSQMAQPLIGFRPDVFTAVAGDPSVGVMPKVNVMSPWESLATTFATSLGGGLLQNYGKQQQANQISALTSLLPQLISDPTSVEVPEDMDSAAFNSIKSKAIAAKAEKQAAALAELAKEERAITNAGRKAALEEKGKILGKKDAYGFSETFEDPESPQAIEADKARAEIEKTSPAVQQLKLSNTMLSRIKSLKDLDSKTSDIPFTTLFIGGLDGSVVKEGEYARVSGANPVLLKYKNLFEAVLNGQSELGVDVKRQLYNEFLGSQKGLLEEAKKQAAPRLATAFLRGVKDPKRALPFDPDMTFDEEVLAPKIPEGFIKTDKTSGGKPVYSNGVDYWVAD